MWGEIYNSLQIYLYLLFTLNLYLFHSILVNLEKLIDLLFKILMWARMNALGGWWALLMLKTTFMCLFINRKRIFHLSSFEPTNFITLLVFILYSSNKALIDFWISIHIFVNFTPFSNTNYYFQSKSINKYYAFQVEVTILIKNSLIL